ncbi:MAG TPA: hypothetical protein VL043_11770 [Protaetiibacter sp.]|nr:hypothetical protein [Protaetiibacter sp.]
MNRVEAEVDALLGLGAAPGQVEHWLRELGLRDSDEPTAASGWWGAHTRAKSTCCPETGGAL